MKVIVKEESKKTISKAKISKKIKDLFASELNIDPNSIDFIEETDKSYIITQKSNTKVINIDNEELLTKNIKQILKEKGYDYKKVQVEIKEGK